MSIKIGEKYFLNDKAVEVLAYNPQKEVVLVKEVDGNLVFILGDFNIKDAAIISNNRMSYTITETEMLDCINGYLAQNNEINTSADIIVKAIRNTHYKIPTYLAEVVAEWYMR